MARSRTAGALFALLISAACAAQAELPANYQITLQTDSFPPFNMGPNSKGFARGDDVQGIDADTVRDIFRRAGIAYNLTLRGPWSRLYDQTRQQPAHGLFSVARTPQNAGQFKWVGPLAHHASVLLAPTDSGLKFDSLAPDRRPRQRQRQPVPGKPGHRHQQQPQRCGKPAQTADRAHRPVGGGRPGVASLRAAAGRRREPAAHRAELSQRTAVSGTEP